VNYSILANIRLQCEAVAPSSTWVKVDEYRLMQYASTLDLGELRMTHSPDHHLLGRGDETLIYFLILDSLNFGSGYFPFLEKSSGFSGYFTVAQRLKAYCVDKGIPTPSSLLSMTAEDCGRIFGQPLANPHVSELMQLFSIALNQLGRWIIEEYDHDYLGFLKDADSVEAVLASLVDMKYFQDVAQYGRLLVPFYKRAQILLQDMAVAEPNHRLMKFGDIDSLTIFADNVLPYVLHSDGVLKYHGWLAQRIENEELIGSGSFEEIELRACTVHAVELIKRALEDRSIRVSSRQLDFCLWNRGQQLKKIIPFKRHRTRCVYY